MRPTATLAVLLVLCASAGAEEERRVVHFLNRFTMGTTPALVEEVRREGIRPWLDRQIEGMPDTDLVLRLRDLHSIGLSTRDILARYSPPIPADASPERRRELEQLRDVPARQLRDAVLLRAVYAREQVRETAADLFRNHFCVAVDKGDVRFFATEYEREVVRANAMGSFPAMLRASAHHPAMLLYLDNALSRRPPTKAELKAIEMRVRLATKSKEQGREASDIAAQRGLNENYARELMELHTLGVDNGYTQRDVENVASALTGWTFENRAPAEVTFLFRPEMHSPKDKWVLGQLIRRDEDGPGEGERILDLLASHRNTARFVAFKLCRQYVCDDPPEDLVDRIAAVYVRTKGDLPSLYRAIVDDPEFLAPSRFRGKLKRPFEFVVSALRATRADVLRCDGLHKALAAMGEAVYLCQDPTGYYDQAEAWQDAGAFAARWRFAQDLAAGRIEGVRVARSLYQPLEGRPPSLWGVLLADQILPGGLDLETRAAIDLLVVRRIAATPEPSVAELAPRIVALILGSPEFQQQ